MLCGNNQALRGNRPSRLRGKPASGHETFRVAHFGPARPSSFVLVLVLGCFVGSRTSDEDEGRARAAQTKHEHSARTLLLPPFHLPAMLSPIPKLKKSLVGRSYENR